MRTVQLDRVSSGRKLIIDERGDLLADQIVDLEGDKRTSGKIEPDDCLGIERVRIVLVQGK